MNEFRHKVVTKDGPIIGYKEKRKEKTYYKFKGIPYGKPPLGSLRFLAPVPISPWKEEIDCTKDSPLPLCIAINHAVTGSEDCLYIEVSSPNVKPNEPLPVMFWIGTCGFAYSIDELLDPTFINNQNVVFVNCGFRLGPFGFLSIQDFSAPGNAGLKDLVLALKWVQRNIGEFGGDPQNVTLFGSSTGGVMVHLMMLSPMASGLFHKAIIQSACALNNWSIVKNPNKPVMDLAKQLQISTTCRQDIVEEMKQMPAMKIMNAFTELEKNKNAEDKRDTFDAIFKPCIEQDFEGIPAFLTKSPCLIIKSGIFNKVPLIIGSTSVEASVFQYIKNDFYENYEKYNNDVTLVVPRSLAPDSKLSSQLGRQLLDFYLGGEESLTVNTRNQYLQLISDYYFLYYVNKTVRLHSQYSSECPVFYYILNYSGEWSVPEELKFFNSSGHTAEVPFIFGLKMANKPIFKGSRDSEATRRRVVKLWTNFAKTGNPTPIEDPDLHVTWDPIESVDQLNYLSIGSELTKGRNPFHERMTFWDELHKQHTFLRVLVHFSDMGLSW